MSVVVVVIVKHECRCNRICGIVRRDIMVTIKDVAKEAGVAISTVSNVLNGVDVVSEDKKRRVMAAVEKLKYVPNMNAKLLKSSRKNTIGLF
jgi:LacI family purine nucleotide synthesis repressor